MEVRVRERLIGALVLVIIIVALVPAILTGGPKRAAPVEAGGDTERTVIPLDPGLPPADADVLMPEPQAPAAQPEPDLQRVPGATEAQPPATVAVPPKAENAEPPPESAAELQGDVRARPEPADARAPPSAFEQPAWAVQLGAFASRDKAERLVADLRRRGYAAFVLEYRANGQVLHRVRVGPELERARAAAIADRLRKDGFVPVVAPHP